MLPLMIDFLIDRLPYFFSIMEEASDIKEGTVSAEESNSSLLSLPTLPLPPSRRILEIVSLAFVSLTLFADILVNMLFYSESIDIKFVNKSILAWNAFYLQVTPSKWIIHLWGFIYAWQVLWIVYAWSFVFRIMTPRTVSWIALSLYACNSITHIIWIIVWGDGYPQVAFILTILMCLFQFCAVVMETRHVDKVTPTLQTKLAYKIDLWISRLLVVNGMFIYSTFTSIFVLLDFGIILQYFADVSPITTGAVIVWLATVTVLTYFALENTVLKRFTSFILIVYPTLIWALSGELSAHWEQEDLNTNPVLTLLLLLLVIILFIARVGITVFPLLRQSLHVAGSLQPSCSYM